MFYLANVIRLNVVLELLRKSTLLVDYRLNFFWPPRVKQFDIRALLFGGYARFIPLDKMVFYGYWKALPYVSSWILHIALTFFLLCSVLCCSLSNYCINSYNINLFCLCFFIINLVAETILFT